MSTLLSVPTFAILSDVMSLNLETMKDMYSSPNIHNTIDSLKTNASYYHRNSNVVAGFINVSLFTDDSGAFDPELAALANAHVTSFLINGIEKKASYIMFSEDHDHGSVKKIFDFCLPDYFDMDDEVEMEEMSWMQSQCDYRYHLNSDQDEELAGGVFDFIADVNNTKHIPESLIPVFEQAKAANVDYILFNLGC